MLPQLGDNTIKFRPLFVALPASLVAAAGFAWAVTAHAAPDMRGQDREIAQAPATPGTPPAANTDTRRERPAFSPRSMCSEQVARRTGNRAYLKARLDLKPEQMATWTAFEKAADEASAKQKARCATLPTELKMPLSLIDRMNMQEERMKARLESVQAVKPLLLAMYASLTPEQKPIVDRGSDRRMHGRHGRGPR